MEHLSVRTMLTIKNTWKTRTKLITAHVEQASESLYCPALSSYPFSSSQETDIRDLAPSSLGAGLPLHHKASNYSGTGLFGQGVNEQEKLPQVQAKHNQTKHPHRIKRLGAISSFAPHPLWPGASPPASRSLSFHLWKGLDEIPIKSILTRGVTAVYDPVDGPRF